MKAKDVVLQLMDKVPLHTEKFTHAIPLQSLTSNGLLATAVCWGPHNLNDNDIVNVEKSLSPVAIANFTRDGTVGEIETIQAHDLTENYQINALIEGCIEYQMNGSFKILRVLNRNNFTIEMDDSGPTVATGGPLVSNGGAFGYNGLVAVTFVDTLTFTYQLKQPVMLPATGPFEARGLHRITASVEIDRFESFYTKQGANDYYMCVVLGDVVTSKDRHIQSDASNVLATGQAVLEKAIQPFSVYVFIPTTKQKAARAARDEVEELAKIIMNSVVGHEFDTYFSASLEYKATFVSHGFHKYTTAYYVHEFNFEQLAQITYGDTIGDPFNVAFRNIDLGLNVIFDVNDDEVI